jgi:hypothetical protein
MKVSKTCERFTKLVKSMKGHGIIMKQKLVYTSYHTMRAQS